MCGRYVLISPATALAAEFRLAAVPPFRASYNIAPTALAPVVRIDTDGRRECVLLRWGLVPAWTTDPGRLPMLNNARAESIAEKPAFREALRARRCIVPVDGYYEWDEKCTPRQPHFFTARAGGPFGLAGLWETWRGADGRVIDSFAIVTRAAGAATLPVHDRMPRVLAREEYGPWLTGVDTRALLERPVTVALVHHPVSLRVNRVAVDDPANIAPVANEPPPQNRKDSADAVRAGGEGTQGSLF